MRSESFKRFFFLKWLALQIFLFFQSFSSSLHIIKLHNPSLIIFEDFFFHSFTIFSFIFSNINFLNLNYDICQVLGLKLFLEASCARVICKPKFWYNSLIFHTFLDYYHRAMEIKETWKNSPESSFCILSLWHTTESPWSKIKNFYMLGCVIFCDLPNCMA